MVTAAHAGAVLLILFLPVGLWLGSLIIGTVLAVWYRERRRLLPDLSVAAELDEKGRWRFRSEPNRYRIVRAACDAFAVRLTLENPHGRRRPLLIMRDAVDFATYHGLCCRIAQRRLPVPETPP